MHLFFVILVVICSVTAIPQDIARAYENICRNSGDLYSIFKKLLLKQKPYQDCDHSVGFHFTTEVCLTLKQGEGRDSASEIPDAMTAYFSEEKILLFINIAVNTSGSNTLLDLKKAFDSLSKNNRSPNTFTVVWMKTNPLSVSSHIHTISYLSTDDQTKSLKTKDFKDMSRNEEQILLKDIKTVSYQQKLNIIGGSSTDKHFFGQSYLIVCLVDNNPSKCKPIQIHEYGISCECGVTDQLMTFIIFIAFWFVVIVLILRPLQLLLFAKEEKEKLDFPMQINCNQKNFKFRYVIGVRLAKATSDFDLSNVNIDLEFFTHKNESVAPTFRFKANVLERQLVTEIRIHMFRLTKMPDLKKIQFNHSGRADGRITLFGIYVYCSRGTDEYTIYDVNKNICRDSRRYPLTKEEQEGKTMEDENVADKTLSNFKIHLSFLELIWISFVNISLIAFMAHFLQIHIRFGSVLFEMLIAVLMSSSVAIVFNLCFVFIYKWMLLRELREHAKMSSRFDRVLCVTVRLYYVITLVACIGAGIYVGYEHIDQKKIETYQWFCVTFCASALFGLVWNISSHFSWSKGKLTTQQEMTTLSEETLKTSSSVSSNLEQI